MDQIDNERFEIFYSTVSAPGKHRSGDALNHLYFSQEKWLICVLADGVSAYPCDWKASRLTCDYILTFLQNNLELISEPKEWLSRSVETAHFKILLEEGACQGMMAAVSIIAWPIETNTVFMINIGDTRIYQANHKGLKLLTQDDAEFVMLTKGEKLAFNKHGQPKVAKAITKSIGQRNQLSFQIEQTEFLPGNALLLCSDGAHAHGQLDEFWYDAIFLGNLESKISHLISEARHVSEDDTSVFIIRRKDWPSEMAQIYHELPDSLPDPKKEKLLPYLIINRLLPFIEECISSGNAHLIPKYLDYLEEHRLFPTRNQLIHLMDLLAESPEPSPGIMNRLRSLVYKV